MERCSGWNKSQSVNSITKLEKVDDDVETKLHAVKMNLWPKWNNFQDLPSTQNPRKTWALSSSVVLQ